MVALIAIAALRADVLATPAVEFSYRNRAGLTASFNGVPVIRGSMIQIVEEGKTKASFSSASNDQQVEVLPMGLKGKFTSPDLKATGTQTYTKTESGFKIAYSFTWKGAVPARIEWSVGSIWARPFLGNSVRVGTAWKGVSRWGSALETVAERTLGTASQFELPGSMGRIHLESSTPWTIFDARGYDQPWANAAEILWLGQTFTSIDPNETKTAEIEVRFLPNSLIPATRTVELEGERISDAIIPDNTEWPLIPRPKQALFDRADTFALDENLQVDVDGMYFPITDDIISGIQLHWDSPRLIAIPNLRGNIIMRVQNLALGPEGYEIRITDKTVSLFGQDIAGLRHAARMLGFLAFVKGGKLCLPCGSLRDWPSIAWRGVHLFGGPEIRPFHTKLAQRVLAPLKFNRVVLQCERTKWDSLPGIATPQFNSKADLKTTFDMYRRIGIEPIPLIQSLGHMAWAFENGKNLDLAYNRGYPFTIDPRKPGTKPLLDQLWTEAIGLLKPKIIHFGMDEFDIRGMPDDPNLSTELWLKSWPILNEIALKHQVTPMFWGDKCLAPGQAIDAALGDNALEASRRRNALPKGAFVGDWHYKNDPKPDRFQQSLSLWRSLGMNPVGTGWFNSDNIRGFSDACYQMGAGYLQSTWAGYESSEEAVQREFRQFAAYVHAADYAWSCRPERAADLPYDAAHVFGRLFYGEASPLTASPGTALPGYRSHPIAGVNFRVGSPIGLISILNEPGNRNAAEVTITPKGLKGRVLAFAIDTLQTCVDRDPVADITVYDSRDNATTRKLLYGTDVRANGDSKGTMTPRSGSLSLIKIPLAVRGDVAKIVIRATSTYAGLRVHGVTAY